MSTGFGLKGKTGRCFDDFEKFALCMKGSDEPLKKCGGLRNEYLECLHGMESAASQREVKLQKAENERIAKEGGGAAKHGH